MGHELSDEQRLQLLAGGKRGGLNKDIDGWTLPKSPEEIPMEILEVAAKQVGYVLVTDTEIAALRLALWMSYSVNRATSAVEAEKHQTSQRLSMSDKKVY